MRIATEVILDSYDKILKICTRIINNQSYSTDTKAKALDIVGEICKGLDKMTERRLVITRWLARCLGYGVGIITSCFCLKHLWRFLLRQNGGRFYFVYGFR